MGQTDREQRDQSQDWQKADARVLGQILAVQNVAFALPDITRIAEFYAQALISMPGISGCRVCLGGKSVQAGEMASSVCAECETWRNIAAKDDTPIPAHSDFRCTLADQPDMRVIAIDSYQHHFGVFVLKIEDAAVFEAYQPFVGNLSKFVALILENRWQKDLLQKARDELESRVEERTRDLTAANEALDASRLAALSIMREAVEARRRAEQANSELQREIVERQRAEQDIALLSFALDNVHEAAFLINEQARFHFVNEAACRTLGYPRAELLKLSVSDVDPDFPPERWPPHWRELKTKRSLIFEGRHKTKDSRIFPVEIHANYFKYGDSAYNLALVHDITERKRAEEALRASEERYRTLVEQASDGIFIADSNGNYVDVNRSGCQMLGYSREQILKLNMRDLVPAEEQRVTPLRLNEMRSGKTVLSERRLVRQDGSLIPVEISGTMLADGRFLGFVRDITERKRAEEEIYNLNQELEQRIVDRTAQLEAANQELRESEARYHRLFEQTQATLAETQALYRVSRSVIALESLAEVLQTTVNTVADALPADRVTLMTFDLAAQQVTHFVKGGPGIDQVVFVSFAELWDGLSGWVLRESKPALSPKSRPDPRESQEVQQRRVETNCGDIIAVPLRYQDKTLGTMIAINRPEEREFTEHDVELMMAMASQTAMAIENARLYEEVQLARAELERRVEERTAELRYANARLKEEVTERKRAEEASAHERALLRTVIDLLPDSIYAKDMECRKTLANLADLERMDVHSEEEALGRTDFDIFSQDVAARFHADDQMVLQTGQPLFNREEMIVTGDGQRHWVLTSKVPLRNSAGQVVGLVGVGRDITNRKRAEDALRESETRYRSLFEDSPISLWEEDFSQVKNHFDQLRASGVADLRTYFESHPEGVRYCAGLIKVLDVNKATLELVGVSAKADLLAPLSPVLAEESLPVFREELIVLAEGGQQFGSEMLHRTTAGELRFLALQINVAPGYEDSLGKVLISLLDVTARKRAEEEIHRLNQQLEQRVLDRTAQLEAANKELEAFAYSVSHDLRAPLRHIDGFLELLQKRAAAALDDEQSRHYMTNIAEAAKRMGLLIDDLLAFSRMGRHELAKLPVDLGGLVQDVIRELGPDVQGRAVNWHIAELPVVTGDRAMLRSVLVNLISNALKFTRPRPQTEIEIGCERGAAAETIVFVRDNGVGFDMQYVDRLFGVFQRLHHVDEFEGTGIGLANVRRIITRHGGRTWATGEIDHGATFYFSLPQSIQGA